MSEVGVAVLRDVLAPQDSRIPVARFIAEESLDSVWLDEPTGRLQRDVLKVFPLDVIRAMQAGYICLRCHEPHEHAFPVACDLCGYSMRDRQIMDIAHEFEGVKHIGPAKPVSEYMAEKEAEAEMKRFDERKAEGYAGGIVVGKSYRQRD